MGAGASELTEFVEVSEEIVMTLCRLLPLEDMCMQSHELQEQSLIKRMWPREEILNA